MSDPAFDVSLTAEGERSMGEGDGGVRGVSSGPLRATTNSTSPRAFCRMLMACWWEMLESSGWPSIARIWSPSRSLPSLQHKNHSSMKHQVRHHGLNNFKSLKKCGKCTGCWWGSLRERGHWRDQDIDGRIILRCIFRKLEGVVGTGWSWLRIGMGGRHL